MGHDVLTFGQFFRLYKLGNTTINSIPTDEWRRAFTIFSSLVKTVFRDDFTGVAGTAIENHTPNIGAMKWSSSVAGAFKLNGAGLAYDSTDGGPAVALIDPGLYNFVMTFAVTGSAAPDDSDVAIPDIYFRYTDANNFCKIFVDTRAGSPPSVLIIQKVNGNDTTQMTFTAAPPVSGQEYSATVTVVNGTLTFMSGGKSQTTTIPTSGGTMIGLHSEGTLTPPASWDFIQVAQP